MTVFTSDNKQFATGNGVTTSFTFSFRCLLPVHLIVFVDEIVQVGGYTVTIDTDGVGGSVTFNTPPANGKQVLLYRFVPYTQESELPTEDDFQQRTVENALDKLTMEVQQIAEILGRGLFMSIFDDPNLVDLDAIMANLILHNGLGAPGATGATGPAGSPGPTGASFDGTTIINGKTYSPPIVQVSPRSITLGDMATVQEVAPGVLSYDYLAAGTEEQTLRIVDGVPAWDDAVGPTGATGPTGPTGPQGPPGATGAAGSAGGAANSYFTRVEKVTLTNNGTATGWNYVSPPVDSGVSFSAGGDMVSNFFAFNISGYGGLEKISGFTGSVATDSGSTLVLTQPDTPNGHIRYTGEDLNDQVTLTLIYLTPA